MKKTIAVCLIALTLVVPVFATGTVGISTGPSFSWLTVKSGSDSSVSTKYSQIYYDVALDGEYFFNNGPIGLAFGIDFSFPLSAKQDGTTVDLSNSSDPYFPTMFYPYVGATYLGKINRQFSWQAGVGMMVGFGSKKYSATALGTTASLTVRQTTIDIYADLGANYDFTKNIRASVGVKALIPVYTAFKSSLTVGSSTTESESSASNKTGFGILPYIGVSYIY